MATTPQDRLAKLFARQPLPATTASGDSHFSEKELQDKRNKDQKQPKWQIPAAAEYPRQVTRSAKPQPTSELLTSSDDDDDYISSFSKKPSMKYPSEQSSKSKRRVMPESKALGYPKDAHTVPKGAIEYTHKGKKSSTQSSQDASIELNSGKEKDTQSSDPASSPLTGQFCQFVLTSKFPYKYMNDVKDRVSQHFFADSKFFNRSWDLYYINPPYSLGGKPLVLVPHAQVQALVMEIGRTFQIDVSVPDFPFTLTFRDDGTPQPIFLGTSHSRNEAADLQSSIPFPSIDHGECPIGASTVLKKSYKNFKEICQDAMIASKKKGAATKKKEENRLLNVGDISKQLRRCQRYLGLRPRAGQVHEPDPGLSWYEQEDFRAKQLKEARIILDPLDVNTPNQYPFEKDPVLISIDVEAYERAHNLITEIGISTLDTLDLVGIAPGLGGVNWVNQIRSRHFRIKGREHLVNRDFCPGNPDAFQFGTSEFIDLSEVAEKVDGCFKWPFSVRFKHAGLVDPWATTSLEPKNGNIDEASTRGVATDSEFGGVNIGPSNDEQDEANRAAVDSVLNGQGDPIAIKRAIELSKKSRTNRETLQRGSKDRNILIVGHAIGGDLGFLRDIGSKIFSPSRASYPIAAMDGIVTGQGDANVLASILEALDTGSLYRILKKETQNRNLASILRDLDRPCHFMHNGGNDARYTLEALVAMTVKARLEDDEAQQKDQETMEQARANEWNDETVAKVQDEAGHPSPGQAVFATSLPIMKKSKNEDLDDHEAALFASSGSE